MQVLIKDLRGTESFRVAQTSVQPGCYLIPQANARAEHMPGFVGIILFEITDDVVVIPAANHQRCLANGRFILHEQSPGKTHLPDNDRIICMRYIGNSILIYYRI